MSSYDKQPRLSARALIVHDGRLLLVNATPDRDDGKWCVPGGGVDTGQTLKENVVREVYEETGLNVEIGELMAVSEFFDRAAGFHQVDLFFRATVEDAALPEDWKDCADVVEHKGFFSPEDIASMTVLPKFLKKPFWLNEGINDGIYRGWEEKA